MKSFLSTYEEQRREMAKIELFATLEKAVEAPCAHCHHPRGEHVFIGGSDICPGSFFSAAPKERPHLALVPPPEKTGEVGRFRVNWFAIRYGACAAAYLWFVFYVLGWLVPELASFAGHDL